jgi:hypothetical protein
MKNLVLLTIAVIVASFQPAHATIAPLPAPAHHNLIAGWTDFVPSISGAYINMGGKEFFYGSYVNTGRPVFSGGTWEVMGADGNVLAHGYGRTPGWVWSIVQRFFGG